MRLGFPRIETGIIYFTPHFFFYSLFRLVCLLETLYCDVVVHSLYLIFLSLFIDYYYLKVKEIICCGGDWEDMTKEEKAVELKEKKSVLFIFLV